MTDTASIPQPPAIEVAPALSRFLGRGNEQHIYRFANGYGASVVRGEFTYGGPEGLWELAVLECKGADPLDFHLTYETPLTDDVFGWLETEAVAEKLVEIAALPARAS